MIDAPPVLELLGALPDSVESRLPPTPLDLRVMAEDSVLIEARDPSQTAEFADLCCGLTPLRSGAARFLGHDWANTPHDLASALRGRIGQASVTNAWVSFLSVDANILLQQLHHTRAPAAVLRDKAAELSRDFGLPGIPLARPDELTFDDLVRAACVRAFLGAPTLIILNSPELEQAGDVRLALLNAISAARDRKAAALWLTSSDLVWNDPSIPSTKRLRLTEHGLVPGRIGS
jgi:phospholipid/cholesterol/gamma-HCH transport system ATP-binding protein